MFCFCQDGPCGDILCEGRLQKPRGQREIPVREYLHVVLCAGPIIDTHERNEWRDGQVWKGTELQTPEITALGSLWASFNLRIAKYSFLHW